MPGPPIAFVNMPFFPSDRPSLGLSLLKSALKNKGIGSDIHYFNIRFAGKIGVDIAKELNDCPRVDLLGEWIFADAVWGHDPVNDAAYLAEVVEKQAAEHRIYPTQSSPASLKDKLLFCPQVPGSATGSSASRHNFTSSWLPWPWPAD
jgi:hypothetical protein